MTRTIALTGVLLAAGIAHADGPRQEKLQWDELQPRIANKKIALVLPDGTRLEGKARAVEADGLRMKITKTSDRKAQPKGARLIPRDSVSVVRVTEHGRLGRFAGALGGAGLCLGIVGAQQIDIYEGVGVIAVPAGIAAGVTGCAIGGYYAGKRLDRHITDYYIAKQK